MGANELTGKSLQELLSDLDVATKKIMKLKFDKAMNSLRDTASLGKLKKERARLKTAITAKSK